MNMLQLQPRLKRLKLGGMLQTLELRLDQAHQERLGHLEFLELMLEDEIQRRQNKALARRIGRARFEETQTLSDFDFDFNPKLPAAQIRDLATGGFIERKEPVLLSARSAWARPISPRPSVMPPACRAARSRSRRPRGCSPISGPGTWMRPGSGACGLAPDLVILDDFGLRAFSERQGEDLYELVSERVRRGSTIVTSNRPPSEWYALFPNPVLAEGALDRLINAAHHITLEGQSYRPRQRPDAKARSDVPIKVERTETDLAPSARTRATERASITTLGKQGDEEENELKWMRTTPGGSYR